MSKHCVFQHTNIHFVCTYSLHFFLFICHLQYEMSIAKGSLSYPQNEFPDSSENWKKKIVVICLAWNYSAPTFLHHTIHVQLSLAQNFVINCPSSWDWHFHWRMSHKCDVLFHLIVIHQENWNPFVAMEMKILEGQQVKITLYPTTK